MPSLFAVDVRAATRKPAPTERVIIDRAVTSSAGLRTILLFEGRKLVDLANRGRLISKRGAVTISRGVHGAQARTARTGSTGIAGSPCLLLAPEDSAVSTLTVSARVRFNGSRPLIGSFGTTGAALVSDDSGRMPLFVSTSAGTFRVKAVSEAEFLSGGSPLDSATLNGWHRVTVTIAASLATLYIDGGATWTGTATQAFSGFTLRAILGSDITVGTEWPWPAADLFYWSRALSAQEVLNHAQRPYIVLKPTMAERWTSPTTAAAPPDTADPWDTPFSDDFGANRAFGVLAQTQGISRLVATANVIHTSGTSLGGLSEVDGAGFLHAEALVFKDPAFATIRGSAGFTAFARVPGNTADFLGAGSFASNASRVLRAASAEVDGAGALTARPALKGSVRAATQGAAAIRANALRLLPFNRGEFYPTGAGSFAATALVRAAPVTAARFLGSGALITTGGLVLNARTRAVLIGEAHLRAKPTVRRKPRVRPGLADGVAPDLVAVEIETFVPGVNPITATNAHGTRAHGTLSRQPQTILEQTGLILASDVGYRTAPTDQGGPTPYPPLLNEAYQIDAALNLEPSRTTASAAWGQVLLANPDRRYDGLIGVQNSDGRPLRLLTGSKRWDFSRQYLTDPPYSTLTTLFSGLATPWALTDDGLTVPLRDATYFLEKPLQSDTFGGSGGYDGTFDLAGKPRPILRGGTQASPVQNITPVLIDPVNRIYQYSDAPGFIVNLYEGAATGAGAITAAGDVTNLYAGTTPFGQYRSDNSRSLFQLGSVPVGQITIDAVGHFPIGGVVSNPFLICLRLLLDDMTLPASMVDSESFNDLAAAYASYVGGVYFGSDDLWSCIQAIDSILTSLGANLIPTRDGRLRLMLLRDISSAEPITASYDESEIIQLSRRPLPSTLDPPPYRIRVGYSHNYTVQTTGINTSLATADRRQFVASPDRFASFNDLTLLRAYRRPNDYGAMPGPLLTQASAQDVANGLGALWGVPRRLYDVILPRRMFGRELGDVVHLQYPVEQLSGGKEGRVVAYSLRSSDATVTYSVLV